MQTFTNLTPKLADPVDTPLSGAAKMMTTTAAALPQTLYAGKDVFATTAMEPLVFDPASTIDEFAFGTDPQEVNVVAVAQIVVKAFKGAIDFMKFIGDVIEGPDTPALSVADIVQWNNDLLQDIGDNLEDVQAQVTQVLAEIDGISSQLNTNLMSDVQAQAFDLFDMITDFANPTSAELNQIVTHGSQLMNDTQIDCQNAADVAPAAFIATQIAPTIMLAVAARIASADYASDNGLGHSSVQNDIAGARALLNSIYSDHGVLAQRIEEEIAEGVGDAGIETFQIAGFDGSHIYRFAVVETISAPGGSVIHRVAGDHTYGLSEVVGGNFPVTATSFGSINGLTGQDALDVLAGLEIDHVVPFSSDHVIQLEEANQWLDDNRDEAIDELVQRDLDELGRLELPAFDDELPSTAGWNETDHGGSGDDHVTGVENGEGIVLKAPDHIRGGQGDDTIEGLSGRDALFGEQGNDRLYGGDHNDKLFGGSGNDWLFGDDGHDKLQGDGGRDMLEGGWGNDVLFQSERGNFFTHMDPDNFDQNASSGGRLEGNGGNDLLVGDNGNDTLDGGTGHDSLYAYDGDDTLIGGAGDDLLLAGNGDDEVDAGSGDDTVEGGSGDDEIFGSWGDDLITGGGGDDIISGGYGVDTAVYYGNREDYSITEAPNGTWIVTDLRTNPVDGTDTIVNDVSTYAVGGGNSVEYLQFDDELLVLTPVPCGGADGPQIVLNTGSAPEPGDHDCEIDDFVYTPAEPQGRDPDEWTAGFFVAEEMAIAYPAIPLLSDDFML